MLACVLVSALALMLVSCWCRHWCSYWCLSCWHPSCPSCWHLRCVVHRAGICHVGVRAGVCGVHHVGVRRAGSSCRLPFCWHSSCWCHRVVEVLYHSFFLLDYCYIMTKTPAVTHIFSL